MADIRFVNASIITMEDARPQLFGCADVTGGVISYVGEKEPDTPAARRIDCAGDILMPGLVNTHSHTAMTLMRGWADDYTLQQWLFERVFPVEAQLTEREVLAGARLGFMEMLRFGVTSASDMYYFQPAVAQLAQEVGIRVSLSNAVLALGENYDPAHDRAMLETEELIKSWHGAGEDRIRADVSIHAEYTSRPAVWRMVADIAKEHGLVMHIHVSETQKEHEECIARYGKTPVAVLAENGVFDTPAIAAHCVWVSDADMDIMAERGVTAAHNPTSNLKLASGRARLHELIARGVNVSLGTDGCCSNNTHDMFKELKLAALLAKERTGDPSAMNAYQALKLATVNGAKAQQRPDVGMIKPGMQADMILLDTHAPCIQPIYDPISAAVYSATGERVKLTMVQGRVLYENGDYATIDAELAYDEIRRASGRIKGLLGA